ncbi:hypothetical protein I6N95_11315 [Vagococcus sp. BWB3-3]|uniref:acetyl-CoA C-acetyltransferase n=1 Tax=Vagococcus allomyrinae TaxID=2794353 RepID=A0A940P8F7_9ENTE|nr:hypothetical protein [Vagococcus allomyrinae]MBP1041596.1 hypothetical protein [Vagococcus allomyrinae]
MEKVVIIGAVRTPIGKYNGRLKSLSESTLCGLTLSRLLAELKLDDQLNEIVIGNSKQTSDPSNLARYAMLDAGLPVSIPAYTVQRHNGSGGQAIAKAYWSIKSGMSEVILAGGAESMSQIPIEIQQSRFVFNGESDVIFEPIERQVEEAQPKDIYGIWGTVKLAEKLTEHYRLTSDQLEAHRLACNEKAKERSKVVKRLFPIDVKLRKTTDYVAEDYLGNHQLIATPADGAASLILTSETYAKARKLPILAEVLSLKQTAGHPIESGVVDVKGVQLVLEQAGIELTDLDVIDLAEVSAAYGLAFRQELATLGKVKEIAEKINPYGSFLESGIPGGATSPIQCVNVIDYLEKKKKTKGLIITQCDGGQTMTLLIKRRG